jgi:Glycosyl transferase family 2
MFVSVVIPVWNGERYLAASIESVLAQTHSDFELIIVDDGSTDGSAIIADRYARMDPRLRLVRQPNQGVAGARNTGLEVARGEWVACLDHDDLMLPRRLERQIAFIAEHPDVKAFGSVCQYINEEGRPRGGHTIGAPVRSRADLDALLKKGRLIGLIHPSVMMHRDTIRSLGGYDPAMEPAEDLDLWMRVAEAGHLVLQDDEVLTKYRVHAGSIIGANATKGWQASMLVEARAAARRAGRPEPMMADFLEEWHAKPIRQRLEQTRQRLGWIYYRLAGVALTNRRWHIGLARLAAAFCLRPLYVASRLIQQLTGAKRMRKERAPRLIGQDRGPRHRMKLGELPDEPFMPSSVSGLGVVDARREALAPQARRLWGLIDRRLVWLCMTPIIVDLLFVAVHGVHTIYASLYTARIPVLGWRWNIGYDRSYLEIFGYLKMIFIVWMLMSISQRQDRPVYLTLAIIFIFALLDDSLEVHETLGQDIADALALGPFAGLRPVDFGELFFWTGAGILLLGLAAIGLVKTTGRDRANGLIFLGALAALMVFAVGVDMTHVMVDNAFRGAGLLFTVLEEGGQQITLSLSCGLMVLIRREIRNRESEGVTRG